MTPEHPARSPEPLLEARPAGRHALLVELPDAERTAAFHAELLRRRAAGTLPPVAEIVPGARTVLLDGVRDPDALARRVAGWEIPPNTADDGDAVDLPVRYDGPDLADVAARWGVAPDEVGALHASYTYRVAFCGFAPGFGYLTGLPPERHVPRRATPRTRVPAGAVALAGPYSAVYPRATPGGWQLIGTMPDPGPLWDPARERAALLTPGTRVRFVRVEDAA
ncbi:5-oxoprolinase subunit B family protein [Streptomyces griseoviridis]|uniref:KipI family sensor histidine kinase inhibitor n=1 Tax=Streptomyces griseoviridis TaxID=45398 RepID=A0ABT9L8S4_STRGD|nr:allophanate hydrolase subunit 1 [Streptomyces griseoviridis]MDP9680109.1 KipI family sensor histidine kinase inhibitor [Streptomyces griseoviridis]GGT25564.1 allophanate hydrolase [Streptomyces griseoviridis]